MRLLSLPLLYVILISFSCTKQSTPPNVVILLADDLGYTDLKCYGGEASTPNLDKLASDGMRFTEFYAPAPNCSPSRTGLLTGRMPSRVGMYSYRRDGHTMHMPGSEITVAELLKANGYQTAHFGKWHLGCLPQDVKLNQAQPSDQGFDFSLGTENNANPSHLNPVNYVRNGISEGEMNGYSCQILANEVKDWFQGMHDTKRPFFLYVAFHEVHSVVASPPELVEKYPGRSKKEAEYLANIENLDLACGKIIMELKNRGLLENTIVLFASDNGPYRNGSAGNMRGLKGEVYEGGIKIPGIIHWPDQIRAGRIEHTPSGLIDVLPTLGEICGFELPKDRKIDGCNIVPLLRGQAIQRNTPLTWFFYRSFPEISMRQGDFVIVGNALDSIPRTHPMSDLDMQFVKEIELHSFELHNLSTDPKQQINVSEQYPEQFDDMKSRMLQILGEIKLEGPYWDGLFDYHSLQSKFKKDYIRK